MIDINAIAIPWLTVQELTFSSPKSQTRTLQYFVIPKARRILLWWLGCHKGWALCQWEKSVRSLWPRAIHEAGPCLQKVSDIPLTTAARCMRTWEEQSGAQTTSSYLSVCNRKWKACAAPWPAPAKWLKLPEWFRNISQLLLLTDKIYRSFPLLFFYVWKVSDISWNVKSPL